MNQDEIIRMAKEAGGLVYGSPRSPGTVIDVMFTPETIERFAELVAAKEREACAKVCDARYMGDNNREDMEAKRCAEAIRARS